MDTPQQNLIRDILFDKLELDDYSSQAPLSTTNWSNIMKPRINTIYTLKGISASERFASQENAQEENMNLTSANIIPDKNAKPDHILKLELVLASAFHTPVRITRVRELPRTRKDSVKEISYTMEDGLLYKVWVFKADPKKTAREMNIYYIAHKAGVPTGEPICYTPLETGKDYPADVAILGGILGHAGDPYNKLMENLELEPELMHKAATSVAKMIADYHVKLTLAEPEFKKYGIDIPKFDLEKELNSRFFAGLGKQVDESLAIAFNMLNRYCSPIRVISHNDIRNENIVTLETKSEHLVQKGQSYESFGVIDWMDIAWDHPLGDLEDFWIHHKRKAQSITNTYTYNSQSILNAYLNQLNALTGTKTQFHAEETLIKSTIWNMLEMYDPVRQNPAEVEAKALRHCTNLYNNLNKLTKMGFLAEVATIKESLQTILSDKEYLQPIIKASAELY